MRTFLDILALAHRTMEGWYEGSIAKRNNNPGNLRYQPYHGTIYGAERGEGGFARFPTYKDGWRALKNDIRAKITGYSSHIDYSKNPTFLDYIKVYAPETDGNNPRAYANFLLDRVKAYNLTLDTPLERISRLVDGKVRHFPMSMRLRRALARIRQRRINKKLP